MTYYFIRAIIPVLMGWIGCELYHKWEKWESDNK